MLHLGNLIFVIELDKRDHLPPILWDAWLAYGHLLLWLLTIQIGHNLATLVLLCCLLLYNFELFFQISDLIDKVLSVFYRSSFYLSKSLLHIRPISIEHLLGIRRHTLEIASTRFFEGVSLAWVWAKGCLYLDLRDGNLIVNSLVFLKGLLSPLNHVINEWLCDDLSRRNLGVPEGAILEIGAGLSLRLLHVRIRV